MFSLLSCSLWEGGAGHHRAASGGGPHSHRQEHRHLRGSASQGPVLRGDWLEQVTSHRCYRLSYDSLISSTETWFKDDQNTVTCFCGAFVWLLCAGTLLAEGRDLSEQI